MELDDRVAVVTGAGQGVGRGIALTLGRLGARVAVLDVNGRTATEVASELHALGSDSLALRCDVGRRPAVDTAVRHVVEKWGAIDAVVNNACAAVTDVPFEDVTEANMELAWRSGVLGTLHVMQATLPFLRPNRGAVVNVGSVAGIAGLAGCAAYGPVKEAIRSLTKVAAREWGPRGIRVNAVCPNADSPARQRWREQHPEVAASATIENLPLGRVGDCETDIGPVVAFLCSDASRYVTGHTVMADGGSCTF